MSDWKPTLYIPLTVQEAPRVQGSLFAPEPKTEPACEHAGDRQRQERIDGGTDELCCACGGKTQVTRAMDLSENTDSRTSPDPAATSGREDEDNLVSFPRSAKSAKFPPRRRANAETRSREYLTRDEVFALADAAKRGGRNTCRDRLVILTLYRHGFRVAELVRLTWDDVTFGRSCTMNVRRVKNGVTSTHPLNGDEVRELKQLQREQDPPSRFVFCSERGGPLSPRTVHRIVAGAGQAAGIPFPVHGHMLRHAKGFQLANRGVDTRAIQAFLGHKRIESTTVYTALDAGRFKDFTED
jgi:integrase